MRKKYVCPKCKAVVHSEKELEYCICGGKYELMSWENISEVFNDMFGGKRK